MRSIVSFIALAWLACCAGSALPTSQATNPPRPPLQLFRDTTGQQRLTFQMMPDDHILDGAGLVMGSFDARSRVVKVGRVAIALDDVVRLQADMHMELVLPIGEWLIEVAASGEVRVNGERWGRVEGFDATPLAWQRLEALFAALPLMPSPASRVAVPDRSASTGG